jgi:hypothetical protein
MSSEERAAQTMREKIVQIKMQLRNKADVTARA